MKTKNTLNHTEWPQIDADNRRSGKTICLNYDYADSEIMGIEKKSKEIAM